MPQLVRAARAATMQPGRGLVENAAFIVQRGVIHEVGVYSSVRKGFSGEEIDLGDVTVVPAPINAHTHLELSHLAGRTVLGQGFVPWVEHLISQPLYELDEEAVRHALARSKRAKTACIADISTRNAQRMAGILDESGLFFVAFHETIGETGPEEKDLDRGRLRHGHLAPAGHALYTTSPEALRKAKALAETKWLPFSLHLAEHDDEVEMMTTGGGRFVELLQARGRMPGFAPPGKRPVALAADLGLLGRRTLAVHCTKADAQDIELLAASGASVCLCPRSNALIAGDRGPWEQLIRTGINVCLGTDSLASNEDLDPVHELKYLLARYQGSLSMTEGLGLITRNPARALGLHGVLGSLETGKLARWMTLDDELETALN